MKRTSMRKPLPPRTKSVPQRGTGRGVIAAVDAEVRAVPKGEPVRSEPYRRLVASLPCYRCRIGGYTQAAHGDMDKGMGIKACDLTCWPGCGPHWIPGNIALVGRAAIINPGCHWLVGTSGHMTRDERREFETDAAASTRLALLVIAQDDAKVRKILQDVGLLP